MLNVEYSPPRRGGVAAASTSPDFSKDFEQKANLKIKNGANSSPFTDIAAGKRMKTAIGQRKVVTIGMKLLTEFGNWQTRRHVCWNHPRCKEVEVRFSNAGECFAGWCRPQRRRRCRDTHRPCETRLDVR